MPLIVDPDRPPFASPADLAARLGVTLTPAEEARAEALLESASGLVRDVAKYDVEPDPIPRTLFSVTVEAVVRVWVNPGAVVGESHGSEQVQYGQTEQRGLLLMPHEERAIRRAVGRRFRSVSQAWPDEELVPIDEDPIL